MLDRKQNILGREVFGNADIKNFCYDKDINSIVDSLDLLVKNCGLSSVKNWSTWDEVPEMGDRLVYDISYETLSAEFMKEVVKCKLFAKQKQIDLAIYPDQVYYSDSKKHMVIYSRFLDQDRRKKVEVLENEKQYIAECIA